MRLNNKGFAISTILYSLLIMVTLILFLLVGNLSFERRTTSDFVNDIKDELNNYTTVLHNENLTTPVLGDNMIPVRYDGSDWVKVDSNNIDNSWYNYEQQRWANVVTLDHTKALDLSGNGNDGIINKSTYLNGNVSINGKDGEYVNCGLENYDFQNSITLLIRTKINSFNSSSNQSEFFGNWEAGGGGIGFDTDSNEIYAGFKLSDQDYVYARYKISDVTYLTSQYNTYVVTYDGTNIKLFLNGEEVSSVAATGNIDLSVMPILAGGNSNNTIDNIVLPADLEISDILIYDRAIGSDEVKQYTDNTDNITNKDELLLWYIFDDNIPIDTKINMNNINTMWVWIPRYSYTIASVDGTNYYGKQGEYLSSTPTMELPGEIDIKFISTNIKEKGIGKYKIGEIASGWYTPDAFTFGDEELSGIWVGKFETSSSDTEAEYGGGNTTSLDAIIKPNVPSWRYINISNAFNVSLKMNDNGNIYGFSTDTDTHMMKNSEWAVVSYLSQSRYGKLGNTQYSGANKEIYQNKSDQYITGCSYGSPSNGNTDYGCQYTYNVDINGTGASTTGNIYGVYDMSGGAWEYVMANYNGTVSSSGFASMPATKYYDKYATNNITTACNGGACLSHALSDVKNWYGDNYNIVSSTSPWMLRGGGSSTGTGAGIFFSNTSTDILGSPIHNRGFRLAATING